MGKRGFTLVLFVFVFFVTKVSAETSTLSFTPTEVIQGEPILVQVNLATTSVKSISFNGKKLGVFSYLGKTSALVGIDLRQKTGTYEAKAELIDGTILKNSIVVKERPKITAPLGIPEKLGGNTTVGQNNIVNSLAQENSIIASLRTGAKSFWKTKFSFPLTQITVTDPYGYSRETGSINIAHKGTDFRAKEGTEVTSINRGVVRLVRNFTSYGKVVVVDHGLGLMSLYLHLSRIKVNEGELVQKGQVVGLSGQTGYALAPHLHLSIRIGGVSVDPVKFMEIFK